jgi:hypothetical protein
MIKPLFVFACHIIHFCVLTCSFGTIPHILVLLHVSTFLVLPSNFTLVAPVVLPFDSSGRMVTSSILDFFC